MIKQKLLATTALVSLVAGSAAAGGPAPSMHNDMSVKIGGMYDAKLIHRNIKNQSTHHLTTNSKDNGIDTNAQLFIEAKNSTAKGLEYGAHVGIRTNTLSSRQPQNGIDRSWLWMEHADLGRVEFGSNNDASESMRIGADRVATATGGINGDWFKILHEDAYGTGISFHEFHLKPWDMPDNYLDLEFVNTVPSADDHLEKARKINYYSPKFNGFQFGASYIADAQNYGYVSGMPNTQATVLVNGGNYNVFSAGLTWDGKISNDIMGSFSVVGMTGSARDSAAAGRNVEKTSAVDFGGVLEYNKLKLAASYGYTGKTGYLKAPTGLAMKKAWYATAGASYEFDKFVTSLTYLHGNKNSNTSALYSLGADYNLAAGITPYAELTHYKFDLKRTGGIALDESNGGSHGTSTTATVAARTANPKKTSGTAFIIGTKLNF